MIAKNDIVWTRRPVEDLVLSTEDYYTVREVETICGKEVIWLSGHEQCFLASDFDVAHSDPKSYPVDFLSVGDEILSLEKDMMVVTEITDTDVYAYGPSTRAKFSLHKYPGVRKTGKHYNSRLISENKNKLKDCTELQFVRLLYWIENISWNMPTPCGE